MLIKLYEENPSQRHLKQVHECLMDGGIIIYPTNTLYGFGCDIYKSKAIEKIAQIKHIEVRKNTFSIVCHNLSQMADYAKPIDNHNFKIIKRCLPGPYTFILEANNKIPKHLHRKEKQVGIRIPDNKIAQEIIEQLGNPMLSSSVPVNLDEIEYSVNPELIYERYGHIVDIVIDAGPGEISPSTIVDMTTDEINIIREGKGSLDLIY